MGKHSSRALLAGLAFAALSAGAAFASGPIPYPNIGTAITIPSYGFTATSTGEIDAYFFASDAGDTESVSMEVNGVPTGVFGLFDHSSTVGEKFDLGSVTKGDALDFFVSDSTTGSNWFSNVAQNSDGINHAYVTDYTGGVPGIPAGTYVGFEDRPVPGSDLDYNDDQFVFTNVSSAPEPSTWAMMVLGFAGLGFAAFRRSGKVNVSVA
jgi:PEP-CTERM motif